MIHCNIHKPNAKGLFLPNEGLLFGSVSNGNIQSSRDSFLSAVRKLKKNSIPCEHLPHDFSSIEMNQKRFQ